MGVSFPRRFIASTNLTQVHTIIEYAAICLPEGQGSAFRSSRPFAADSVEEWSPQPLPGVVSDAIATRERAHCTRVEQLPQHLVEVFPAASNLVRGFTKHNFSLVAAPDPCTRKALPHKCLNSNRAGSCLSHVNLSRSLDDLLSMSNFSPVLPPGGTLTGTKLHDLPEPNTGKKVHAQVPAATSFLRRAHTNDFE